MEAQTSTVYGIQYTDDHGNTIVVFAEPSNDLETARTGLLLVQAERITAAWMNGRPTPAQDDLPVVVTAQATVTFSPWVPVDEATPR